MSRARRLVGAIAAAWIVIQGASLAVAPVVLWAGTAAHAATCTCTSGEHAICPLHHAPSTAEKLCLMRSAHDPGGAVLASVFGFLGLMVDSVQTIVPRSEHALVTRGVSVTPSRFASPDPPPPRL